MEEADAVIQLSLRMPRQRSIVPALEIFCVKVQLLRPSSCSLRCSFRTDRKYRSHAACKLWVLTPVNPNPLGDLYPVPRVQPNRGGALDLLTIATSDPENNSEWVNDDGSYRVRCYRSGFARAVAVPTAAKDGSGIWDSGAYQGPRFFPLDDHGTAAGTNHR